MNSCNVCTYFPKAPQALPLAPNESTSALENQKKLLCINCIGTHPLHQFKKTRNAFTNIISTQAFNCHKKCVLYHVEETMGLETCELIFPIDGILNIHAITCGSFDRKH